MDTHQRKPNRERGFTIIEVMVAAMLLVTGVLGTVTLIDGANALSNTTKAREGGVNLAREIIEVSRSLEYEDLNTATLLTTLQAQPGLNDDDLSVAGWQVDRRAGTGAGAIRYLVEVFACTMDDAKDGARAASDTATYCNGSAAAGSTARIDNNPDDLRRVEVDVKYQRGGQVPSCVGAGGADVGTGADCVQQATLIPNPSGGLGPAVRNSTLQVFQCTGANAATCSGTPLASGQPVEPPATGVRVTFSTSQAADQVTWSVNDANGSAGTATNSDATFRNWTLTWVFPSTLVDDRAYQLNIQAFLLGASGNPGSAAIPVNLSRPSPPDVDGTSPQTFGFSTRLPGTGPQNPPGVTDVLWAPGDAANDINNYQVFRADIQGNNQAPKLSGGNPDEFVAGCGPPDLIQSDDSCFDPSPPWETPPTTTGVYNYYVVALDSPWTTQLNDPFQCSWNTLDGSASGTVTVDPSIFPAGTRPGCPSELMSVDIDALAANEPRPTLGGALTVATDAGAPRLTWNTDGVDGNGGTIEFYRVYRRSSNAATPEYADRYGVTDGADAGDREFIDRSPGATNLYWVTAVDDQLNESDPIGPVQWP